MPERTANSTEASKDGLRGNVEDLLGATICGASWTAESGGVAEYAF